MKLLLHKICTIQTSSHTFWMGFHLLQMQESWRRSWPHSSNLSVLSVFTLSSSFSKFFYYTKSFSFSIKLLVSTSFLQNKPFVILVVIALNQFGEMNISTIFSLLIYEHSLTLSFFGLLLFISGMCYIYKHTILTYIFVNSFLNASYI